MSVKDRQWPEGLVVCVHFLGMQPEDGYHILNHEFDLILLSAGDGPATLDL